MISEGPDTPRDQQSLSGVASLGRLGSVLKPGEMGLEPFTAFVCLGDWGQGDARDTLGDQGEPALRAISLQPVPWDYPSAGIDFTVRVRKCTLPVLDVRDKRQTGQGAHTLRGGEGEDSPIPHNYSHMGR